MSNQIARYNQASENLTNGFTLMGNLLTINNNTATNNMRDGFHFMGYDQIIEFANNTSIENTGAGVLFGSEFAPGMSYANNVHNNNFINNNSIGNCGLTNNFKYDGVIGNDNF